MDTLTIAIVMVVLGMIYRSGAISSIISTLFRVTLPPVNEPITGRPILDLMVHAAIEKYKTQPLVVQVLISLAKQIDKLMDDAGIPELPDIKPTEE